MDTLVVKMGSKHSRVAELTRSAEGVLRVGRSFDNDLVLTDRHVAPQQIEFCQTDAQWQMKILDRTNPVLLNNKSVEADVVPVHSGDKVMIGRTRLSLYSTSDSVEPTHKLLLSNWLTRDSRSPLLAIFFLLAVCLIDFLLTYFEGSTDLNWQEDAGSELFAAVIIVLWAGVWALAGRIFRQQHHMGLQLLATTAAYLLAVVLSAFWIIAAGSIDSVVVGEYALYLLIFVVLVVLFQLNLLIATSIRRTLTVAVVLAALVVGVPYAFFTLADSEEFEYEPEYAKELVPPLVQFDSRVTADEYFGALVLAAQGLEIEE